MVLSMFTFLCPLEKNWKSLIENTLATKLTKQTDYESTGNVSSFFFLETMISDCAKNEGGRKIQIVVFLICI